MRFLRFNGVGVIGFVVQLAVLTVLVHLGVHYLVATAAAIEAAVLHNFLWHERWTWRDRPATGRTRLRRLWHFHVANGLVSQAGNLALMWVLVDRGGVGPLAANAVAVVVCGLLNFLASERFVFVR